MWGTAAARRIFAYTQPTDMRKSFLGLLALVQPRFREDPYSGNLFVFVNRRGNYVKILAWDRTGFSLYAKRLEQGRFAPLWEHAEAGALELTLSELALYLEGSRAVGRMRLSPAKILPRPLAV